nr:AAA family ATPase [uncultured Anaerosporobacter sp.]
MLIQKVKITNFRGFKESREFIFNDRSFIFLSAQNGLGKTTIIDAIEWCLTGTIGRLKNSYDSRSTNDAERKKNLDGILKNKKAANKEKITVEVKVLDHKESYIICREQKKDELNPQNSVVTVNGKPHVEGDWLDTNIDNNFYNLHFCDIQKSFGIQNKKRQDLPEMFTEFITDYSKQETVAANLEVFLSDISRKKEDYIEREKKLEGEIEKLQEKLIKFQDRPTLMSYPQTYFYEGEEINLEGKNEEDLQKMKSLIYACGYSHVTEILRKKVRHQTAEKIITKLNELKKILSEKGKDINKAINLGLDQNDDCIIVINKRLTENRKIIITKDNISRYVEKLDGFNNLNFTKKIWEDRKKEIDNLEGKVKKLNESIDNLSDGNTLLKLLSEMVIQKPIIMTFRSECVKNSNEARCPICGSESFGLVEEEKVLAEAQKYIEKNGVIVQTMIKEKEVKQNQIKNLYNEIVDVAKKVLQGHIDKDQNEQNDLELLKKESARFFDVVKSLNKLCNLQYTSLELASLDTLDEIEKTERIHLIGDEQLEKINVEVDELLELLGYNKEEQESDSATIQRTELAAKDAPVINNYSKELLVGKINALTSALNDNDYMKTSEELCNAKESRDKLNVEYNALKETEQRAQVRANEIRDLIVKLKAQEYEMVGPNLYKFYKKLTRINTIEGVQVSLEDKQVSITDEEGNLVVNILSNGQLNVFMLAYFFAGIISRSREEKFKVYFIDDLTSCMDDVNMLAFLDLMKYQLMEQNGPINQIFFATCDERICKLLRYKLDGCGMQYREIAEVDFVG